MLGRRPDLLRNCASKTFEMNQDYSLIIEKKAENLIAFLYQYFRKFPEKMPEQYQQIISASDIDRAVCDYISGMSDSYAVNLYSELCIPEFWK